MKKLLLILLTVLTCFNVEAIPITHAAHPARVAAAASAARRQRERLAEKQQHEEEFHHGELVYEAYVVETFTFKDSVPTIETWEIQNYYYNRNKTGVRILKTCNRARNKREKKMIDFVFTLVGATFVITIISIILIVLSGKKKLSIGYKEIC